MLRVWPLPVKKYQNQVFAIDSYLGLHNGGHFHAMHENLFPIQAISCGSQMFYT